MKIFIDEAGIIYGFDGESKILFEDQERVNTLLRSSEQYKHHSVFPPGIYTVDLEVERVEQKRHKMLDYGYKWEDDNYPNFLVSYDYRTVYRIVERKEEQVPTSSQTKWEPKIVNEFLDASQFSGNDRINHFLVQALKQLTTDEMKSLYEALGSRIEPSEERKENHLKYGNSAHPLEDEMIEWAKQESKNWKCPSCFMGGVGFGMGIGAKLQSKLEPSESQEELWRELD